MAQLTRLEIDAIPFNTSQAMCARQVSDGVLVTIDADGVQCLTKGDNILFIRGDRRDQVEFTSVETDGWCCSDSWFFSADGRQYRLFTATRWQRPIQVYIDREIRLLNAGIPGSAGITNN